MRKSYIYIIGATMLLAPASALAQSSLSPRTAIAVASPPLLKAPAAQAAAEHAASSQLSAYVTIDPARTSWQQLGVTPIAENASTATVRLTLDALHSLAKQQVYNLAGAQVENADLAKGVYIVKVTADGKQTTKKVLVK